MKAAFAAVTAYSSARMAFALRLALVCTVTALIVESFQTPEPALTVYMTFFLNKPDRMSSILVAVVTMVAIVLIIAGLFPLAGFVVNDPLVRIGAMALLSFTFVFLGSATKLHPFAATFALITAYVLDLLGSAPGGELVTRGLLYVLLFVGIPAAVSIVADLLIAPAPRRMLERLLGVALSSATDQLIRPDQGARVRLGALRDQLAASAGGLLHLISLERTSHKVDVAAFRRAAASTQGILACVEVIDRLGEAVPERVRVEVASVLTAMAAVLANGGYPINIAAPEVEVGDLSDDARTALTTLRATLEGFAEADGGPAAPRAAGRMRFFAPDAFSNPIHIRHALKTTFAAMTCYLLFQIWDWPGIHTALITCFIVSLGTAGETVEKLSLRIAGGMVGAAAGLAAIMFILPDATTITDLLAVVVPALLVAAWVAAGSPRIAYAGFQIAFAFLLCVMQGSSPGFDLSIARDRVMGILLGDVVTYLVFTRIWPVSITGRIDAGLRSLLAILAQIATAPVRTREALAARAHVSRASLGQDLMLAWYEPKPLRAPPEWLRRRGAILEAASRVEAPLLVLGLAQPDAFLASSELLSLSERIGRGSAAPSGGAGEPAVGSASESLSSHAIADLRRIIEKESTDEPEPVPAVS